MIGVVFFLFVFAVFVIGIDQFWQMTLDDAVRAATRQVQIGKITTSAQFSAAVCNEFAVVAPNCAGKINFFLQTAPSFYAMSQLVATLNPDGTLTGSAGSSNFLAAASVPQTTTTSNGTTTITKPVPQFLLVQVIYPLPFRVLLAAGGVATENGTSSLLSTISTVMSP